jgi:uncharacterized protein (TIGR00251 family)
MQIPKYLVAHPEGTLLKLYVQPRASRDEITGVQEDSLRIRITAPPVDGEANRECVRFLSKIIGVPKSQIEIFQGLKSRHKVVLIRNKNPEVVMQNLFRTGTEK